MHKLRNQKKIDRVAYSLAMRYLLSFRKEGISHKIIQDHVEPTSEKLKANSISEAYRRLLESAQNRSMGAGVIGKAIGGIDNLKDILFNFNPKKVVKSYRGKEDVLLNVIIRKVQTRKPIRRGKRALWPLYCKTIVSGAEFLLKFRNADELYKWINVFYFDKRKRPALPLLLSFEIKGIGFPLACDFLKEIGYMEFGKPDRHIKDIFKGIGLIDQKADDYEVYKAIVRVANSNHVTPYNVDKLFWLIGSGNFYNNKEIGIKGKIKTNKKQFIKDTKHKLLHL
ncbi:MAG: hypothetical protein ACLQBC_06165 [Syntrophales bacterium]